MKRYIFLWIGAALVNLKGVFADFGPDQTYAMATSYRHLAGDRMFQEMWEPHQTSGFLSDFGMWLFGRVVPSYEGAALFMQLYGVLLYAVAAFVLYRVLKKYLSADLAHLISLFFFTARPKLMVYPEFSNMHIAFSVLLYLCLLEFLEQKKWRYLFLAAGSMCLLVLSYPSCLVSFLGAVVCLFLYADQKWKSICVFAGSCMAAGGIYAGYFLWKTGADSLVQNLHGIFVSDVSHTGRSLSLVVFFRGTFCGIAWVLIVSLIAVLIRRWKKADFLSVWMGLFIASDIALLYIADHFRMDWTTVFFIAHACVMGTGAWYAGRLDQRERRMWVMSMALSLCSAVSVLLLTNQEFLSVFAYMIPGVMMSFLPVSKARGGGGAVSGGHCLPLVLFCLLVILHRGLAVYGYMNAEGNYVVTDVENIVRVGPTRGIVTSLEECNQAKYGIADWQTFTEPGETVLMVETAWYDPIVYLYQRSDVAAYSVIDTPAYDESLEKYWKKYGDKRPDVVAVKAWNGVEERPEGEWFGEFLGEYYRGEPAVGTYWHFYHRK